MRWVCLVSLIAVTTVVGVDATALEPKDRMGLVGGPAVDGSISTSGAAGAEETFAALMSGGRVNAGTLLTSGRPAPFSLPAVSSQTIFVGDYSFQIVVPNGATRLEVRLTTTMPNVNFALFVRFGADVTLAGGFPQADRLSLNRGGNQIIVVRTTDSSRPLQAGTYYIAVGVMSSEVAATGTILATVDTGPTLPIGTLLASGTPAGFSFSPISETNVFIGEYSYGIVVPAGAGRLEIQVTTSTAGVADIDLYARADRAVALSGSSVVADYDSRGPTGNEIIAITPSSTPPLQAGTYYMALGLRSLGTAVAGTIVATVSPGAASPAISAPLTLDFGMVTLGQSKDLGLTISNTGGSALAVASVASSNAQFRLVSPSTPFSLPPSGTQALSIRFQPTAAGTQTGTLTLASNDPVRSSVNVTVTGSGQAATAPPAIAISTASLNFTAQAGGSNPATQTFTVRNSGGGTLNFQVNATQVWLSASPTQGSSAGSGVTITASVTISGLAPGSYNGEIRVVQSGSALSEQGAGPAQAGPVAIAVLLTVSATPGVTPVISQAGVVHGASFQPGIASGSWVTILGVNLAATMRTWRDSDFIGNRLPTQLDGVSVNINGKPAYVYYISPTQINVLAPGDGGEGSVAVEVVTPRGRSASVAVQKQRFAPGFFMFDSEGRKYLAAVHTDGTLLGKPNLFQGAVATRPANPGEVILLFGTGFGPTDPATPEGEIVRQAGRLTTPVIVRIGNVFADVAFAGVVGAGLYQFNVTVPNLPDGDQAVVAEIGGSRSQANALITVQSQ